MQASACLRTAGIRGTRGDRGRRGADRVARTAPAGSPATYRRAVPCRRRRAHPRGRDARDRSRRGAGDGVLASGGIRGARRNHRRVRAVGRPSRLDARRGHPRHLHVHRRTHARLRRDGRGCAPRDRKGVAGTSASRATREGARRATATVRATANRPPRPLRPDAQRLAEPPAPNDSRQFAAPPVPDTSELVVRATHVEAPPITDGCR